MPYCAADLEAWWLAHGRDALDKLVSPQGLGLEPRECGFAQAVQHRLRVFDNDHEIEKALRSSLNKMAAAKALKLEFNPRRKMHEATRTIFRKPEDGGVDHSRALEGLEYLDLMELHRRRLLAATRAAMAVGVPEEHHPHVIEELHRQTAFRYRQFHMGLRACVSRPRSEVCFSAPDNSREIHRSS